MNKLLLFVASISSVTLMAQPSVTNSSNLAAVGFSASVTQGPASSGTGSPGANQTWNFSSAALSALGTMSVIAPSNTPYTSSFPTANWSYALITSGGTVYSYFNASATKMEVLAYTIAFPGTGNDYTPGPRTTMPFPNTYLSTTIDSWQKVGNSVSSVTVTYDGYGTLITPTSTYTNVIRMAETYSNGTDYMWYNVNPLMPVFVYDHNNNTYIGINASFATGIEETDAELSSVVMYPNPANNQIFISKNGMGLEKTTITFSDCTGRTVKTIALNGNTSVDVSDLTAGIYFYMLQNDKAIKSGKVIIE